MLRCAHGIAQAVFIFANPPCGPLRGRAEASPISCISPLKLGLAYPSRVRCLSSLADSSLSARVAFSQSIQWRYICACGYAAAVLLFIFTNVFIHDALFFKFHMSYAGNFIGASRRVQRKGWRRTMSFASRCRLSYRKTRSRAGIRVIEARQERH